MKKYLFLYAVAVTALLVCGYGRYRRENRRLTQNQHALAAGIERYRTRLGQEAASVQALRLRCAEFEELRAADAAEIRRLGIKLRRLEAAARTATATKVEIRTPVRDTVVVRLSDTLVVRDTLRLFRWRDAWVRVEGAVTADSVLCRVESADTLRQVVHRIPRRFLFIRWGTKALRQEIVPSNPHTRIVYSEYVKSNGRTKYREKITPYSQILLPLSDMERTAIFPGSFDPFTRGHAALVDEALNLFDRVVIGIGNNTAKTGLLTVANRKRLIDDLYAGNPRVEAHIYTGLTGEFAEKAGACAIIRGVRNTTDFEYERTMEATNHRIYPDITTVMLFTPSPVADISSSTVREVLSFGRSVEEFMPKGIDINKYL